MMSLLQRCWPMLIVDGARNDRCFSQADKENFQSPCCLQFVIFQCKLIVGSDIESCNLSTEHSVSSEDTIVLRRERITCSRKSSPRGTLSSLAVTLGFFRFCQMDSIFINLRARSMKVMLKACYFLIARMIGLTLNTGHRHTLHPAGFLHEGHQKLRGASCMICRR